MLQTKAVFRRKDTEIEPKDCVIDKVIHLSGAEFDRFSHGLMREWDFLRDNRIDTVIDKDGRYHCLLVVGEGRRDGILVNPEGASYAHYSAFMSNAEDFLTVGRSHSLAELNKKLTDIVDKIVAQAEYKSIIDLEEMETDTGIDLSTNGALRGVVLDILGERPESFEWELDKNELIVYRNTENSEQSIADISDPTVSKTDMFASGYSWDGMIPLGKDRALELFDSGHEVFRLYENDAEGAADSRRDIEVFDGMFGIEDPSWVQPEREPLLAVFILNRENHEMGETSGEWLPLPAGSRDLCDLFERIGIACPSEDAFAITAIRVPEEYLRDEVTKYDSLDELNLLASYMHDLEDFERDKFQAILTHRVVDNGNGTAAIINVLYADNFDAYELIDANNTVELAKYYDRENSEKPDNISFADYGTQCVKDEGGVFTEWGYLKFRNKSLSPEYTGEIPDVYRITDKALYALRLRLAVPGISADKPSVMKQIKAAQQIRPSSRRKSSNKNKGGQEL